jgi:formylglycine-generating enzyme required for sulfatase activity
MESLATVAPLVLTPTPLQPTQTPISPVQLTPLGIDTTAFRVHDGVAMQFVPAGQFMMGTDDPNRNRNSQPQHPVMLADFWIDQTEVTNAQYALCVEKGLCQPPTKRVYIDDPAYADHPVTFVTYEQAGTYCLWLASASSQVIGLPTEAQWEKAAAWDPVTSTARLYPWGSEAPSAGTALGRFFGGPETLPASPVGTHPAGASSYGVHDMAGNVWEWVADWFDEDYYRRTGVAVDPTGPTSGTHRVTRGGSWRLEGYMAVSSFRNPTQPNVNGDAVGFRCAMTVSRPPVESGIAIAPVEAAQMLGSLVQQSQSDEQNDAGTMAEWLDALSDLHTALSGGDTQKATGIIVEYTQRLASHRNNKLITPALAFRLERGMAWIQKQIAPVIP